MFSSVQFSSFIYLCSCITIAISPLSIFLQACCGTVLGSTCRRSWWRVAWHSPRHSSAWSSPSSGESRSANLPKPTRCPTPEPQDPCFLFCWPTTARASRPSVFSSLQYADAHPCFTVEPHLTTSSSQSLCQPTKAHSLLHTWGLSPLVTTMLLTPMAHSCITPEPDDPVVPTLSTVVPIVKTSM